MNQNLLQKRAFRAALLTLLLCVAGVTNLKAQVPTGAINSLFAINENGDRVYFSQGNLQYQASSDTWRFAENQWDYSLADPTNFTDSNGWIDLFSWEQTDWGWNAISNGGHQVNSGWRTLTHEEWNYVLNLRPFYPRYAKAQVNNVKGLILLPDEWDPDFYPFNYPDIPDYDFTINMIGSSQWSTLEQNGAVFLPAACHMYVTYDESIGSSGYYWSTSYYDEENAWGVYFSDSYVNADDLYSMVDGLSVRLVRPEDPDPSNFISFEDPEVKDLCVANWDANSDGELSYAEAAAVTNLGSVFNNNSTITSFDELQYFTGLTSISNYAFYYCQNLTSIILPNTITSIGDCAFCGCSDLTSLTIPKSLMKIDYKAFADCTGLSSVYYTGNIEQWCSIQFGLYSNPLENAHLLYINNNLVTNLVIPESVINIGDWAFSGCQSLGSITLPNTLKSIGRGAFYRCTGLTSSLVLPNTLTTIGDYAFYNCSGLTGSLILPNTLTTIGDYAFQDCSGLTGSLVLPNTLTSIGDYSFTGCSGLTGSLTLPESLMSIGEYSFWCCSGLSGTLTIPNNLTNIGNYAFCCCEGFTGELVIPDAITRIGALAFYKCNGLSSVTIGTGVIRIDEAAFSDCNGLKEINYNAENCVIAGNASSFVFGAYYSSINTITIGENVQSLPSYLFKNCSNVQVIKVSAITPPVSNNTVFSEGIFDAALYVPCESQATYQADPVWGTFTNYQNKAFELVVESEDATQGEVSILKYGDCDDPLCTVSANPMPHYGFSCWLKNGEVISANRVYNFNIEENTTLIARFEPSENIAMHWVPNNEFYEDYMMLTGVVNIDSVEQTSTTLELGAFCNDECRGSVLANYCPPLDRYVYQLPVYGNNGDVITFKLFDHNSQQELTMERLPGVMIGDENSSTTSNYFPFYTLYNYSIAEQLYLANELIEAGMNTTPIASLSFEATNETGKEQKNISIWMANVSDAQLTTTSHNTAGMTLVYTGNITPVIGWNEIVFNQNQFAWDGSSNLLICVERSNGEWNTSINWKSHTAGFNAMAYHYRDSSPYNMAGETYTAYTSASRVNTRFRNTSLACQTELVLNINNVIPADDSMVIYFVSRIPVLTTPSPAEGGEVTGTGEYLPGETVTVTATPYENYVFTGWMENGTLVSTDLEYTFTVESVRNLIARFERVQTISLNSGWNWFSTYIEQNNINGLALLENSLEDHGLQIKSMNDGFVQYDNETNSWSGSLSSITNEQLYMIQTNAETSITLHGHKAKPSQHSISINQGWNWIGYWCDTEMGLEEAMASISPTQNDAVKSRTAFSSYFTDYGWYGNLQTLVPGQGYQYVSQNANTKILRYPTPSRARNLAKTEAVSTHFDVKGQSYRDNMNFMAVVTLDDLELNGDRYELAAFVDDVCHGTTKLLYVEPLDRYVAFLTVLGQDGEEVSFRLYDDQTGTTYEAEAHEAFHTNVILGSQQSLYPIHFKSKALADNRPAIYPNPANKGASLSIVNASDDMVMEITNMLGVTVKTMRLLGENTTVDFDLAPGAYTVRLVKNHETVMIEKLIVK